MKNSTLRVLGLVWAMLMIAVLSSTVTLFLAGRASQPGNGDAVTVSRDEYDTIERYRRLDQVRQTLMERYYQELDEDALILGAVRGMTGAIGDPYTFYYTPEELQRSNENMAGKYQGIGTLLQNNADGSIEIIRVYPDSPAEAAGLRAGDVIAAVDGVAVSGADGRSYNSAVCRVRGEGGTQTVLTILRDGERLEIPVTRGNVAISYAQWQMLPGNIGYISISQFSGNASDVFHQAIAAFKEQGAKGLVVDLRNNPGGLLDQVVSIADSLLPTGVIVYVRERDGVRQDYYSDENFYDVPLAVLVNSKSASASEILAMAVQALNRGVVVGTNTYGKGIVQSMQIYHEDEAALQLTTSSYYDALDRCPQGVGVQPDVEVALVGGRIPDLPDVQSDNQLAEAVAQVMKQAEE